ncbi:hypothetical protein NQ317_007006 [Molorchus minor]|uniref:ACAD9/ACADV-like C-terminal domain-containing protein n=1 Tax=Molorchus minor TaxID=1323400 RepID=A0ABQ9JTP0_9CUCU|nr:hypothetical protein NQ317_007006 [Molorchus minor]
MEHLVHKDLAGSANLVAKSIDSFGQAIEMVLIKYGKNIVNEQFILNRLAGATFDIFTSTVALSRASQSLKENLPSAAHEKLIAEVWTNEAMERVALYLKAISTGRTLDGFSKMSTISKNISAAEGIVQINPLRL